MLTIHKASAGSGKTFALTREYLRLLLAVKKHDDATGESSYRLRPLSSYGYGHSKHHGSILAVTFTNKATEEMTSRIIAELSLLGTDRPEDNMTPAEIQARKDADLLSPQSPYEEEFVAEFKTTIPTLRAHANKALADILYNFSWFNVSTIDSFFQKVLKSFTRELDLSPNANLELNDQYPLAVAVSNMLTSLRRDFDGEATPPTPAEVELKKVKAKQQSQLKGVIEQFMMAKLTSGESFNLLNQSSGVFSNLLSYTEKFFSEEYKLHRQLIDGYLADPNKLTAFIQSISLTVNPATKKFHNSEVEDMKQKAMKAAQHALDMGGELINANLKKALENCAAGVFDKISDTLLGAIAMKDDPIAPTRDKRFKKADKKTGPLTPAMEEAMKQALTEIERFLATLQAFDTVRKSIYLLSLFAHVNRFLDEYRRENDTMLLSDTNDLLHRIINEDETPFIYERMGTAIRHYLIDEFQDTSKMQWKNLQPLVLESLSADNDNLIIGDEKQCIYRFRNAEPSILGRQVQAMANKRSFTNRVRGINIDENCNWRSSPQVVTFNNTLFQAIATEAERNAPCHEVLAPTYASLIQKFPEKNANKPGYVKIEFLPPAKSKKKAEAASDTSSDNDGEQSAAAPIMLEHLTREISRELAAGVQPKDIAVLVRKNGQGKEVISHLMSVMANDPSWPHGQVQIMSADSMAIGMSAAVKTVVNVLRLLANPTIGDTTNEERAKDPAYNRLRLLHRFELGRYDTVTQTDEEGREVTRRITDSEALARAVAATSIPLGGATPDERQTLIDRQIDNLINLDSPTLSVLTDCIIDKFLAPEAKVAENSFITAFQDLVADFSENGDNNVAAFIEWWDRSGSSHSVQPPEGLNAINVMTIHKSKGLEFACVHVPFFNYELVSYHSSMKPNLSWYKLDPTHFPGVAEECIPPMIPLENSTKTLNQEFLGDQGKKWITEQTIDILNVAYVALTRAKRELIVYADQPTENKKGETTLKHINEYLLKALTKRPASSKDKSSHSEENSSLPEEWSSLPEEKLAYLIPLSPHFRTVPIAPSEVAEENASEPENAQTEEVDSEDTPASKAAPTMQLFEMGDPYPTPMELEAIAEADRKKKRAAERKQQDDEAAQADDWAIQQARINSESAQWLNGYFVHEQPEICITADYDDITAFDYTDDRYRGIFLHDVLSRVKVRADLPKALHTCAYRYRITPEQRAESLSLLETALADPQVVAKEWFDGATRVVAERRVSVANSRSRRPDRIVWHPDGSIDIIDYKFGESTPEHNKRYTRQVRNYIAMLAKAGHPGARGWIWYPLTGEVVKVK